MNKNFIYRDFVKHVSKMFQVSRIVKMFQISNVLNRYNIFFFIPKASTIFNFLKVIR